jgi:hypothetical protein
MRTTIDRRTRGKGGLAPLAVVIATVVAGGLGVGGCHVKKPVEQHFYETHIQPIFDGFCVNGTSPCHKVDPQTGIALGNLDLTSFENVQKRPDVLRTYGTYPQPLLLLKSMPESQVTIPYLGKNLPSEIRHTGGKPLSSNSDAFYELKRWLDNGANRDGILPIEHSNQGVGKECNRTPPPGTTLPTIDPTAEAYTTFQATIRPFLEQNCAFSTCHYSPQADFSLLCDDAPGAADYNFVQAASFIAPKALAVEGSELLMRPLSGHRGGINHTGGVFFASRTDPTWDAWKRWAVLVQDYVVAHPLTTETKSPGRQFFETNVMPKLLVRGCALEGCHSPSGFNDYRLRPGALGFLSQGALKRNYEATVNEFMALDTVDVKQSRAVKKTILRRAPGASASPTGAAPSSRTRARRRTRLARRRSRRASIRRCPTTPRTPRRRAHSASSRSGTGSSARIARPPCRRWPRATSCRSRSSRARRTATTSCSSTRTRAGPI